MTSALHNSIARQRASLGERLASQFSVLAEQCSRVWHDRRELDDALSSGFRHCPYCTFIYAVNPSGTQVSANTSRAGLQPEQYGRDRSYRPYMQQLVPGQKFMLSEAYISETARRPSVTALQAVRDNGRLLGYIGADFDLRELPMTAELYHEPEQWQQIKGDPAIRGTLFQQQRVDSLLDHHIDNVLAIVEDLIVGAGIFHCKLHFSSSRATIWMTADPYRYRILALEDLIDPEICFAYPPEPYSATAVLRPAEVRRVLEGLRQLRYADETLYLRAGSLNIYNGMVGLTFSCDGSHYMPASEFLDKDLSFWTGMAG